MDNLYASWIHAFIFVMMLQQGCLQTAGNSEAEEICQWETFNATCPQQEVVVMKSAEYGRMRLSRCIATEVYIGCSADILPQVDSRCSGRPSCAIHVPDSVLHRQQPCPKDMMAYLQAAYTCVKVSHPPKGSSCAHSVPIQLPSSSGYLSNAVTNQYGYGSASCPWLLKVPPGQRIRFSLFDFTLDQRYSTDRRMSENTFCTFYAILLDKAKDSEYTVCAGQQRHQEVYTSFGNEVEVQVPQQLDDEPGEKLNFLLQYEAIGCPDPIPPVDARVRRIGEKATVSCNFTSEAWHLVCKGDAWVGEFKNCTLKKTSAADLVGDDSQFPSYGLIVAIVIGVSLGIVCGFAMLAAVLLCRKKDRHCKSQLQMSNRNPPSGQYGVTSTHASGTSTPCKVHRLGGSEYGYTHVWEVQGPGGVTTLSPHPHLSAHYAAFRDCHEHHTGTGGGTVPTVLYRCKDGHMYETSQVEDLTLSHQTSSGGHQMPPFYHDNMQQQQQQLTMDGTILQPSMCDNDTLSRDKHNTMPCNQGGGGGGGGEQESMDTDGDSDVNRRHQNGYHLVPTTPDKDMPPPPPSVLQHSENHYS